MFNFANSIQYLQQSIQNNIWLGIILFATAMTLLITAHHNLKLITVEPRVSLENPTSSTSST